MTRLAVLAAAALAVATPVSAGTIERACLGSDRPGTSRALCGCIQDAADLTLSNRDQRKAAGFFSDPHRAQEIRTSDRGSDEAFWTRYREFGATAETFCRS